MSAVSSVSKADIPDILESERLAFPLLLRIILIALMLLGLAVFIIEILAGGAKHAWTSFHVNFLFWFCIAAAASGFTAVFHICNAQWSRPIVRIFQSALPFLLISPLFIAVLYFGHTELFVWSHEPLPGGKGVWLSPMFLFGRNIIAVAVLALLTRTIIRITLRRDYGAIEAGLTGVSDAKLSKWKSRSYRSVLRGWSGDSGRELEQAQSSLGRLSPILVVTYALVMSLVAFDLIMSVDPHWYSTMFGGFYFMSGVYMAMAWVAINVAFLRNRHRLFLIKIDRRVLHDLGKLLFGFGIFWAYLFWSHYLPIWYGNLPEETGFIIVRLREAPWHNVAWMVLACCFIIPFWMGLNRDLKQVPILLMATGTIAMIGGWLDQYLLFAPTLYPDTLPFALSDIAITLGFAACFIYCSQSFLSKVPLIPFGDFYRR